MRYALRFPRHRHCLKRMEVIVVCLFSQIERMYIIMIVVMMTIITILSRIIIMLMIMIMITMMITIHRFVM